MGNNLKSPAVWALAIALALGVSLAVYFWPSPKFKPLNGVATAPLPVVGPDIQNRPLSKWVDDLDIDSDRVAKDEARTVLKGAGRAIIPELLKMLTDKTVAERRRGNAAQALGHIGNKAQIEAPALMVALKDSQAYVRYAAVYAVFRVNVDHATLAPIFAEMLSDPDFLVRRAAADNLGNLGKHAVSALPTLEAMEQDANVKTREVAVAAVAKIKDSLTISDPLINGRTLTEWVDEVDPRAGAPLHAKAITALQRAEGDIIGNLITRLQKPRTGRHRGNVAQALGHLGSKDGPEAEALLEALEDTDNYVVFSAIYSLRRINVAAEKLVPLFVRKLEASDKTVRRAAADNLGSLGAAAKGALPALEKVAQEEIKETSVTAKTAIARIKAAEKVAAE